MSITPAALNGASPSPIQHQERKDENIAEDPRNFTIPVYKDFKIRIYKPMILLKLALFVWSGCGTAFVTFLSVFFKQRGITLAEMSTVYALTPFVQFIGPAVCGIIADKIGRSKPVLVANFLIMVVILVAMLFAPSMNVLSCEPQPASLICQDEESNRLIAKTSCDNTSDIIYLSSCNLTCPENVTQDFRKLPFYCFEQDIICQMIKRNEDNVSISVNVSSAFETENECFYNVTSISHKNITYLWCTVTAPYKMYCSISCWFNTDDVCSVDNTGRTGIFIYNMVLIILFFTVFSSSFRFLDVTAMALVKEHDADYGRQRFFAVFGILIISPFLGFLVDATTIEGGETNYDTAFYFLIGMIFVLLAIIYKLKVQIKAPGKNMWKKTVYILKSPDVITFVLVLIILGTSWGFMKNYQFWYLEGMNAPSLLLGLIPSVGALYGLPFLLTSNWWLEKVGTTQIFLLGLLGYVGSGIGYSLLYDPWLSLLIEASNIVTYHLLWVAVLVYSHSIAPEGLTATVISSVGGIHFSIASKGFGGLAGGLVTKAFGLRMAYRIMAITCLISAAFYAIYLFIRKKFNRVNSTVTKNAPTENTTLETKETAYESYILKK